MTVPKTIRMPKELLDKWLAALRSSEIGGRKITQAQEVLHNGRGGYCCLGVLQVCAVGRVRRNHEAELELPAMEWLKRHGIEFSTSHGLPSDTPHLPSFDMDAAAANDSGVTFAEIADAIEACAEGV